MGFVKCGAKKVSRKLYRVTCRGMKYSICGSVSYGVSYVVAETTDEAYEKVRKALDAQNLGFRHERELESIELIAEEGLYPECSTTLYIVDNCVL